MKVDAAGTQITDSAITLVSNVITLKTSTFNVPVDYFTIDGSNGPPRTPFRVPVCDSFRS